ncbi:MAG: uracil-DNA glycosylase family protein, partial [Streptococcus sp.]|nr:uracil-DNA glycosylase family protein [Streptococcus sp.]
RNQIWMAKNPWFEAEVVPELQTLVQEIIQK